MSEVLAALVVVPIVGAVFAVALDGVREYTGWAVALATMAVQAALTLDVMVRLVTVGPLSYTVGGYPAAYGIELVVDGLTAAFLVLVMVVALGLLAYTRAAGPRANLSYGLYLLLVAGLTGVCVTADVFNIYVFLEISGLTAYALVARSAGGEAAVAALKYLFIGTIGASLYLLGIGYAYVVTGTLNMARLAAQLPDAGYATPPVVAAFALIAVGLGIKMALVPLHTWLPDAHSKAPVAVSVLLSGVVTAVAAYELVRLSLSVFTVGFFEAVPLANDAILLAAAASVLYGGHAALRESKVKRVLAYSTIAQVGLATLGVGLLSQTSLTGAVIHLVGHGVMKGGLFLAAGSLTVAFDVTKVEEYAGLARRAPYLSASFAVLALGMVGLPPTVGFLGKWYIAVAAVEAGAWPVAALVFVSTLLSLAIFGPVLHRLYFQQPGPAVTHDGGTVSGTGVSTGMRAITVAAAVLSVLLGFAAPYFDQLLAPVFTVI